MAVGQDQVARYSRVVRWMKILLPVAALALIAAMFLIPRERSGEVFSPEDFVRLGAGLKLDNPRFSGQTDAGEPFEVSAEWALPDGAVPDRIELHRPVGTIVTGDSGLVTARADKGFFSRKAETLRLTGEVRIETADGYRFETAEAHFGIGDRTLSTPGPVTASGPMGSIEAGSMRGEQGIAAADGASDGKGGDARIWFENRVRMVIIPESSK